jgi:hypothetical protein
MKSSALALLPSRHRSHAMLASHKRQCIWFDIISEVLPHSRDFESSTSALRATINDHYNIVLGRSKNFRDGLRITHHGRNTGSDGNRTRIRGRTALVFDTYSLVIAGEAKDDMESARVERKF